MGVWRNNALLPRSYGNRRFGTSGIRRRQEVRLPCTSTRRRSWRNARPAPAVGGTPLCSVTVRSRHLAGANPVDKQESRSVFTCEQKHTWLSCRVRGSLGMPQSRYGRKSCGRSRSPRERTRGVAAASRPAPYWRYRCSEFEATIPSPGQRDPDSLIITGKKPGAAV